MMRSVNQVVRVAVLLLALLCLPAFAAAQPVAGPSAPAAGSGRSVGTLVAAALETAGYTAHSMVLSDLAQLLESLAALIVLVCIMTGIFVAALHGRYDGAKWLLIGPPLFFFLIKPGSTASGVEWQFGAFRDRGELNAVLRESNIPLPRGRQVSSFFHNYNRLVSSIVQDLVGILTNRQVRTQFIAMTRQGVMDQLFAAQPAGAEALGLMRYTMTACGPEMEAARRIGRGINQPEYRRSPEFPEAIDRFCNYAALRTQRSLSNQLQAYLQRIRSSNPGASSLPTQNLACTDFWKYSYYAVMTDARLTLQEIFARLVSPQAEQEVPNLRRQIAEDVLARLSRTRNRQTTPTPELNNCAALQAGNLNANVTTAEAALPIIFTAWYMRHLYSTDPRGQMTQTLFDHAGLETQQLLYTENQTLEGNQAIARRHRLTHLSESAKWEAYTLAMLLPYVQGAGLFALATLFPFFALMVLIPGRGSAFFSWCALWVWLKSWDIGWALVMIIDEVLWSVMPHTTMYRMDAVGRGFAIDTDPVTVFEAAFEGDYSFNLSNYYMLIGAVLSAVPMLSAHAVLGSKRAVAGVMVNGLKSIGQSFGKVAGDWVAAEQVAEQDRHREMSHFMSFKGAIDADYRRIQDDMNQFRPGVHGAAAMQEAAISGGGGAPADVNKAMEGHSKGLQWNPQAKDPAARGEPMNRSAFDLYVRGMNGNKDGKGVLDMFGDFQGFFDKGLLPGPDGVTKAIHQPELALKLKQADLFSPASKAYGAPTLELENYRRQIAVIRREGDILRSGGETLTTAAGGIAALGLFSGVLEKTGVGRYINPAQVPLSKAITMAKSGIDLQRLASLHEAKYLHLAAEEHWYRIAKEAPIVANTHRSQAASTRGEHWATSGAPHTSMGDAVTEANFLIAEAGRIRAMMLGSDLRALLPLGQVQR